MAVRDIREHATFLRAAIGNPALIGALAPSTHALGRQLAAIVPRRGAPTVVELGPGTGTVSAIIRRRLPPGGRQLAVERDPTMLAYLHQRHPWLHVLPADAANLPAVLAGARVRGVDAIVSGLPWSLFAPARQEQTLNAICQVLEPDGGFTTFAYLHTLRFRGARGFRALLEHCFDEVVATRAVWLNLPPALVFVCRRAARRV